MKQRKEGGKSGGDGLTVNANGNLYITSELGLQVFAAYGKLLGIIRLPEQPANVAFDGKGCAVRQGPFFPLNDPEGGVRTSLRLAA